MNKLKVLTLKDRIRNAIKAFKGKEIGSIQFGVDVKRCDECEHKNSLIRDNQLVTAGARAAYLHSSGEIDIPGGLEGEDELAYFVTKIVDYYYNELVDVNFDAYIETELIREYGKGE